jgi:hypothetical protein
MAAAAAVAAGVVAMTACSSGSQTASNGGPGVSSDGASNSGNDGSGGPADDASNSGNDGPSAVAFYGAPGLPLEAGKDTGQPGSDAAAESGVDAASESGHDAARDAPMVVAFYGLGNPLPDAGGSG